MNLTHAIIPRTDAAGRMDPRRAKLQAGLAVVILLIAVGGVFLYEGWRQVAYVVAFGAMGLGNLAWSAGSLLPEGNLARGLRFALYPLSLVMLVALAITLGFQFGWIG